MLLTIESKQSAHSKGSVMNFGFIFDASRGEIGHHEVHNIWLGLIDSKRERGTSNRGSSITPERQQGQSDSDNPQDV